MTDFSRKLIKYVGNLIIKSTNQRVVLYTKEIAEFFDKLAFTKNGGSDSNIKDSTAGTTKPNKNGETKRNNKEHNNKKISGGNIFNETIQPVRKDDKNEETGKQTSEDSINSRTSLILESINNANSQSSLLKRLESLNDHFKKYPDGTYYANKIRIQNILLKLRKRAKDTAIEQVINETLSMMGYSDPPSSGGVRILSLDGGGMRGIVAINILQQLEHLSGRKIHQLFDFICGVSTGAIIACCSVPPITLELEKLRELYLEMGRQIFKQSALKGAGKLVFSGAYYETSVWEKLLRDHVSTTTLLETTRHPQSPKLCVLSTFGDKIRVVPFLFRNYSPPEKNESNYPGSFTHTMFEAVRASAAAPSVFEEFKTGEHSHLDGGIVANNPAGVAIHEAKLLWPGEKISCLVSCGTGKHSQDFNQSNKSISWKMIFGKVLESATDTEAVHTILKDLLPKDVYHRFNPILTFHVPIDEVSQDKIEILEQETDAYCRKNEDQFTQVASLLKEPRSLIDRTKDRIKLQIKINNT